MSTTPPLEGASVSVTVGLPPDNTHRDEVSKANRKREAAFLAEPVTARWIRDLFRYLPVKSQFVLSGNIRDLYPFPVDGRNIPLPLDQYLASALALRGFRYVLAFDIADGFRPIVAPDASVGEARRFFNDRFALTFETSGRARCSLARSMEVVGRIIAHSDDHIAVLADFASRYAVRPDALSESEHEYFTRAVMMSHTAAAHASPASPDPQYNPILWLCDRETDIPGWLALDNPRLRSIVLPPPDHVLRRAAAAAGVERLPGFADATEDTRLRAVEVFVEQTDGMILQDLMSITVLSRRENLGVLDVMEAVRRYKLGVTEDPWQRIERSKIAGGLEEIGIRVKGQNQAIVKALDIIKRAMTGLSGAQGSAAGGRPRGVMFLAGPTGVGKTELAKSLTELLFGDERAYIRFDMSEFSAEHADARLLGAPPGYVGYEAGGELVNAIREKPFAVVLFDEIEKAHPRILDKFLQLLDDGVLTSGRGERVYFSEAVIVFTSNLGIFRLDENNQRVPNVSPEDSYEKVERAVRDEITRYFTVQLNRPEILNRIGENIVVFDFIRPDVATQIFKKMAASVVMRLRERRRIELTISTEAGEMLQERCIRQLDHGGRGIGNQLEAWLINPLARALFDAGIKDGSSVRILSVSEESGVPTVALA